jgi:type II secretory pathway component PulK
MRYASRVIAVRYNPFPAASRERGDMVLSALLISFITSLLIAALVTVVTYEARIAHMQTQHLQTYWAARGEAVTILKKIRAHESVPSHSSTSVADIRLDVSITGTSLWQVSVSAQAADASTTILFTVNSTNGAVVSWKEDQPLAMNTGMP